MARDVSQRSGWVLALAHLRGRRRWGSSLPCSMKELASREPPSLSRPGIQPRVPNLLLPHHTCFVLRAHLR